MTLSPNTQITKENVGLLKAGDRVKVTNACSYLKSEGYPNGSLVTVRSVGGEYIDIAEIPYPQSTYAHRFTYIGPDLGDGWIGWSGGENPVPGMRSEVRFRSGALTTSDTCFRWDNCIRRATPAQPDTGYTDAFYQLAEMMGLPASPQSPRTVWETVMRPRLQDLLDQPDTGDVAALREALEPFAENVASYGKQWSDEKIVTFWARSITVGDLRRADRILAALSKPNAPGAA